VKNGGGEEKGWVRERGGMELGFINGGKEWGMELVM
jgi:hypothetical protein